MGIVFRGVIGRKIEKESEKEIETKSEK